VAVSIRWDIPGILRFRSETAPKRRPAFENEDHQQAPLVSDAAQHVPKVAVVWLFSSAILFARCAIAWSFHQSLTRLACRPAGIDAQHSVHS